MMRSVTAAAVLLALVSAPAAAQDLAAICARARRPPVGAWAQYRWQGGRMDGTTIRMSIVGRERRNGSDYIWLEIVMHGFPAGPGEPQGNAPGGGPQVVSKVLVPGFGEEQGGPLASVIKVGDAPAMEMPVTQGVNPGGAPRLDACRDAKVIGWESVTVPGGTFRAVHVQSASGRSDTWLAPDLPFAMVKEAGTEEGAPRQMLLVAHGTGARSLVTGKPRPFDPRYFAEMMTGARRAPPPRPPRP